MKSRVFLTIFVSVILISAIIGTGSVIYFAIHESGSSLEEATLFDIEGAPYTGIWLTGDGHMHTNFSDGGPKTVDDRAQEASNNGLDFIILTDHFPQYFLTNESLYAYYNVVQSVNAAYPDVGVYWCVEWTLNRHLLPYGMTPQDFEPYIGVYPQTQEAINISHSLGGVTYAAHPVWSHATYDEFLVHENLTGFEGYNPNSNEVPSDFIEVGAEWDKLLMSGKRYITIGNSDAHGGTETGQAVATFVYCPNATWEGILEGYKNGIIYYTESIPVGPDYKPLFRMQFTVNNTWMGQTLTVPTATSTLRAWINVTVVEGGSTIDTISIIQDGKIVEQIPGAGSTNVTQYLDLNFTGGYYYRIIANDTNGRYVVSNPVFLDWNYRAEADLADAWPEHHHFIMSEEGITIPDIPWGQYIFSDPENDTQSWSTNATLVGMGASPESNAEYDVARDLKELWVRYDADRVYFRLYVKDLVNDDSLELGAIYHIQIHYASGGQADCAMDGRTFSDTWGEGWERSIYIFMQGGYLYSKMKDFGWTIIDDQDNEMTVEVNFTGNYVETSAPWEDLTPMPEYLKMQVISFKPGEVDPWLRVFDPGAPGTPGEEWANDTKQPMWGPDAADAMPGGQNQLDWNCWTLMDHHYTNIPQNRIDGWLGPVDIVVPPPDPHGTPGAQTLYATVKNENSTISILGGRYKVAWTLAGPTGIPFATFETVGWLDIAPNATSEILTYDVSAILLTYSVYYVTVECYYLDAGDNWTQVTNPKTIAYSFRVV